MNNQELTKASPRDVTNAVLLTRPQGDKLEPAPRRAESRRSDMDEVLGLCRIELPAQ